MSAAVEVVGRRESEVFVEDLAYRLDEQLHVFVGNGGDVAHGFAAQAERGVVVVAAGMLDEEQGGGDGAMRALGDDVAVEEGLEVIVAVIGDVGWIEDGSDVGQGLQSVGTCLVVDHADTVLARLRIGDAVEAVDDAADS